ncbi:hypothetical protein [Sphingobacterium cavernae]|uniref:hypothetical protein n=1 Tax=Sphingobacterium cavernae TaxID=2592657 RepID=UPI0012302237|nr:hypothetical protein [Sphingobacterium cavernae]
MKNENEMCQFSALSERILVPADVTAKLAGCSESAVKKVRNGFIGKTGKGKVCQNIVLTDQLLKQAILIGVKEVAGILESNK